MTVRSIDAVHVLNDISWHHKPTPVSEFESGFNQGLNQAMWTITHAPTLTPPNEPRMINADKLAKRIAGHSNYHGDSILAAIYCAAEGKENDAPIRPIETTPNEWVSVEERLPEKGENVLVYAIAKYIGDTKIGIDKLEEGERRPVWFYTHGWFEVTHWMPLPAPPKKELDHE